MIQHYSLSFIHIFKVSEPPEYSCNIYIPLNSSEYVIINDTLYLTERENISFPPDKYMSFGDDVAVCADDFMPSADSTDTGMKVIN